MNPSIENACDLPLAELTDLVAESTGQGFNAIQRLVEEWVAGINRFDRFGEALFIARKRDRVIGICGLNIDPYANSPTLGRIRRLYVLQDYRRQGIGRALVERVVAEALPTFECLHARTSDPVGDRFYRSLGFTACSDSENYTHELILY
jgi:GNAT superfamily N-acetyltransferase